MKKNKLPNDYFPHDFNARYDRKILRCRKVLGIEGYGIYWMLIETLCLQENFSYPIKDIDLLADDFGCSVEKVEAVVKQFELFQIDKEARFFSMSLIARMQKYLELSEKARKAINIRWDKARKLKELQENNTDVLPTNNESNTIKEYNIKEKKIKRDNMKEKERKENKKTEDFYFESVFNLYVLEFGNLLTLDKWKEWIDYRSEINHKLTKSTAEKQILFLLKQSNPAKCIDDSITNGWQGLFPQKTKEKKYDYQKGDNDGFKVIGSN